MKEQFVTYEIALALEELGFNKPCLASYYTDDERNYAKDGTYDCRQKISSSIDFDPFKEEFDNFYINSNETYYVSAPLWQQVIDWCDSKGLLVGTIIVDNLYKSTINKINYETELFHSRNESIKQAIAFAIGYLQDNK